MNWADGITDIIEVDGLGVSPAMVNRRTGVVYVNPDFRNQLSADQWFFILLHEYGHLYLKTTNEAQVDDWAFREYVKRGYKLSESVYALTKVLSFSTGEHYERAEAQLRRAQEYDRKHLAAFTGTVSNQKYIGYISASLLVIILIILIIKLK
jgi:hypothetical protein